MATITITTEDVTNWAYGGSSAYLRIFPLQTFLPSGSTSTIQQGSVSRETWYKSVTCSVTGTTLTIPETTLPATTDSNVPTAQWLAIFYSNVSGVVTKREAYLGRSFRLPHTPTTTTWAAILTYSGLAQTALSAATQVTTSSTLSVFAPTTSAQLASVITDETGTGSLVFGTSPTLTTPILGVATITSVNKITITQPASGATLTLANGSTLATSGANSITLTSTGITNVTLPTSGTLATSANKLSAFAATTSAELAGVISDETGSGALVFGTNPTFASAITVGATGGSTGTINFKGSSSGTITLTANAVAGTYTLTLPTDDGNAGQILSTNGSGALSWINASGGGDAMVGNSLAQFAATTSAELRGVISDETGSGVLVFGTSPALTTPNIGVATATSVNKVAVTAPASAATLTLADGSTLATSGANSITLTSSGSTNVTLPTTGTLATLAGSEALSNKTIGNTNTIAAKDTLFTIQDDGDATKLAAFQASGITTGTTRTFTFPDASGTLALTSNKLSAFAATTSAELAGVISDETGSGALVFGTAPTFASTMTVGTAGGTTGAINLKGTTSGTVTVTTASAAGTWTMTLPNSAGSNLQVLQTDGAGVLSWVTLGGGGNALTSNPLSQFAATTSAQLAGVISDETGSGALVFANTPTLVTPVLGVATATSVNKVAITAPATSATLTLADGSTLATSGANSITLTSSGATNVTLPTSGTLTTTSNKLSVFAATSSSELAGVISDETGSGSLVFANTPTLVTPDIGVATATTVNKVTITAPASAATLTIANNGSLITSGGHSLTFTTIGTTTVTLPTSGTLATVAGTESLSNKTLTSPIISSISNTGTLTLPTSTDTLVGRATTDTLTNKSISGSSNTLTNIGSSAISTAAITPIKVKASVTLTDAATVAIDASLSADFYLETANSRTLGVPSGTIRDGQFMSILIKNTSGGNITPVLSTGSSGAFVFTTDIASVSAIPAGHYGLFGFKWNVTTSRWMFVAYTACGTGTS